jgi:UPF0755 protein
MAKETRGFFTAGNTLLTAAVALVSVVAASAVSLLAPKSFGQAEKSLVYVTYGSGFRKVAFELKSKNLLRNGYIFQAYVLATGAHKKIKAGEYEFSRSESMAAIAEKMVEGDVVKHKVVFPEGSDIYDIAAELAAARLADPQLFISLARDPVFLKSIGLPYQSAEGFLFPDTYNFVIGEGEKRIIEAMYARFREKSPVDPSKTYSAGGMSMTGYKLLKLASIIEKESMQDGERPKVASVFYNRMRSPEAYQRRLESCATVRYALNKKTGAITYKDTRVDSPYNTYIIIGLPVTPICNPGVESIEAALKPADTDYRYFVVRESGEHAFSVTLQEHERAKSDYKKKKRAGEL